VKVGGIVAVRRDGMNVHVEDLVADREREVFDPGFLPRLAPGRGEDRRVGCRAGASGRACGARRGGRLCLPGA
jgi:hypothetical protein